MTTVQLKDSDELLLQELRQSTGLSTTELIKKGLQALKRELSADAQANPYAIYAQLDLGPGGYAKAPATEVKKGVREAIERKLKR